MAIYHLHASKGSKKIVENKDGRLRPKNSALAKCEYDSRQGKYKRSDVAFAGYGNMPDWIKNNPRLYWQAADQYERKNGRLFRSYEFSLPIELTEDQQKKLAQDFCKELTSTPDGKLPYSFVIHVSSKNPHCHLMVSERVNDGIERSSEQWFKRANVKNIEKGGARKTEFLKSKEMLIKIRKNWADMANSALQAAGHEERIDHRSYAAQGIGLYPQPHLGPNVCSMEKKGKKTRIMQEYREKEKDRVISHPQPKVDEICDHIKEAVEEIEMKNYTKEAIERQLKAMGCDYYDVALQSEKGLIKFENYSTEEILESIKQLQAKNANEENIFIRPAQASNAPLILLDDLTKEAIDVLESHSLKPACVIETSPGNFQAWIKLQDPLKPLSEAIRRTISKNLTHAMDADPGSVGSSHFGRLAGFTNRKPAHQQTNGKFPFVLCRKSSGEIAEAGDFLIRKAEEKIAENLIKCSKPAFIDEPQNRQLSPDEAFKKYWQEWKQNRKSSDLDYSQGDFAVACRMIAEGYGQYEIADAMSDYSPNIAKRHSGHISDYSLRTAAKAAEITQSPEEPEEDDEDFAPGY